MKRIIYTLFVSCLIISCSQEVSKSMIGIGFDPMTDYETNVSGGNNECHIKPTNSSQTNTYNYMYSENGKRLNYCSAPSLIFDEELVFTAIDENGFSQYYSSSLNDETKGANNKWEKSTINRQILKNSDPEKGVFYGRGMYTEDFERFYFCKWQGTKSCMIYRIIYNIEDGNWGKPEEIKAINENNSSIQAIAPFVYTDENDQDVLYFSVRENDKQKFKIKRIISNAEKQFQNIGESVIRSIKFNKYNQITPFYDRETDILYFSSDIKGSYDVHKIENNNPKEVKYPRINLSNSNEAYYTTFGEKKAIYMSDQHIDAKNCSYLNNPGHIIEISRN